MVSLKVKKFIAAKKVSVVGTKTGRSRQKKAVTSIANPNMVQGLQQDIKWQDGGDDGNSASFKSIGQST
jgi:hypothetical protein